MAQLLEIDTGKFSDIKELKSAVRKKIRALGKNDESEIIIEKPKKELKKAFPQLVEVLEMLD